MKADFGGGGATAGAKALALQPRVSESDLEEFVATPQGRDLARLAGDIEVMLRLSVEGFNGRAWDDVAGVLAEYGWTVIGAWIRTGEIFRQCKVKGLRGGDLFPPPDGIPEADKAELTNDTVADALISFRDGVLSVGRWDASKGASIATFFIGNCLLRFVNRYRSWLAEARRVVPHASISESGDWDSDPASLVVRAERIDEILAPLEGVNREIVQLDADGCSIRDIGELVGLGDKQVEARLYRSRKKLGRTTGSR